MIEWSSMQLAFDFYDFAIPISAHKVKELLSVNFVK